MLNIEDIFTNLQAEGLTLSQVTNSQNPEVQHALTSKVNQTSLFKFQQITEYLKPYPIEIITDLLKAEAAIHQLSKAPLLGFDIETSKTVDHPQAGLNPKLSRIRLVQLFDGCRIYLFDCHKIGAVDWIRALSTCHLIAHNATFEAQHFYHNGTSFTTLDCTMLMGRVFLNKNLSLKDAAYEAFGLDMDKSLQVSHWSREDLLPEQYLYAALDAVVAYQLYGKYQDWFKTHPNYLGTYHFLKALIYPLVHQQAQGIKVDTVEHQAIINQWQKQEIECRKLLEADGLSNPKSVKQLQNYLRSKLFEDEVSEWPKTKNENLATDKDSLSRLEHHPTLRVLAEFKTTTTRLANFGPKLSDLLVEGELYPSYQIAGMVSGRFGCSKPNIQNQPRTGFKHIYVAPEGWKLVTGDLAQVELRVAGLIAEDSVIIDAYAQGKDLHKMMAAKMTGKAEDQITKAERTAAKGVNFGLLFGGGAKGLKEYVRASYGVDMTLDEAKKAKSAFHATYKDFTDWQKAIVKHTNSHDESESIYCRLTRHYDEKDHYVNGAYKDIYTHAMNYPIQSTAWELLALAIFYVDQRLPKDGSIRISHHVYDELCLCARDDQVTAAKKLLLDAFQYAYLTVFPGCNTEGIIEVGAGQNWVEAANNSA